MSIRKEFLSAFTEIERKYRDRFGVWPMDEEYALLAIEWFSEYLCDKWPIYPDDIRRFAKELSNTKSIKSEE